MKNKPPRYIVFPARSDEDGRNWVVRDTKDANKPEEGRLVMPFRSLDCALNFARLKNRGLTKRA